MTAALICSLDRLDPFIVGLIHRLHRLPSPRISIALPIDNIGAPILVDHLLYHPGVTIILSRRCLVLAREALLGLGFVGEARVASR